MISRSRATAGLVVILTATTLSACAPDGPPIARGEAVFDTCSPCHGEAGLGNETLGAPAIAGLPQWYVQAQLENFEAGRRGAHPMDTVGIRMKSMARALDLDGDMEAVAEYVASLPVSTPPVTIQANATAGQAIYEETCVACHGPDARGIETLRAPPLVHQADWYLFGQFQKFRKRWRGADPTDIWGIQMQANAGLYTDDQVRDVLAYIQTLR